VATPQRRRITFNGLALVTAAWTLDALVQAVFGTSALFWSMDQLKWLISGHGLCTAQEVAAADRLPGVFGPCNLKFGQVLAAVSPFLLFFVGQRMGRWGWLLAAALVGVVLVLAGSRASWISYALVVLFSGGRLLGAKRMALVVLAGVAGTVALGLGSSQVRERFARTQMALSGDASGMDQALSGRSQIWGAALCMVREHPLNGVGVRDFRRAYPQCDPSPQRTAAWGDSPALHAHQIVLEILAETGVLGLLLWMAGAAMAIRAWIYASPLARDQARPAALALATTVFPLNTHLAFYSTFWGGVLVVLAALYAGALLADEQE
jgi:O-antigen ligase